MIVCLCKGVTAREINSAVADGATSPREVAARCRAGTGCGMCVPQIREIVAHSRNGCEGCPILKAESPSPYLQSTP
jgi:bacterioferritin-associated ferredoxin